MISIAKQISIFMENKPGRIGKIARTLGDVEVRIEAMMIADAGEFGIIKLIVHNHEKGKDQLISGGFTVAEADVIVIRKEYADRDDILQLAMELEKANINTQYAYGFTSKETLIVMKTDDFAETLEVLKRIQE